MPDLIRTDRTVVRRNIILALVFDLLILAALSSFIAFWRINDISFHHVDESTHVRVTQEMSQTGDLWHPSVFGKFYYNKPPFKMWVSLIPVAVFGHTNFGYRFIDGACGVLSVIALYLFARAIFRSRAIAAISALALITSRSYVFHHGLRTATQDSMMNFLNLLTIFIGWRICSILRRESSGYGAGRKKIIVLSIIGGILVGLAVMTKNVGGYLPLFIVGVFALLSGDYKMVWKRGKLPAGIVVGIGLLIPALYLVPHCLNGSSMCAVMLGDEVYDRVTIGYHNRGRPLFYLKHLWHRAGPPPELLIPGILIALGYWIFRKERRFLLPLVWGIAPVLLFTFIPSRLTWYMVPAFPGLALLCGIAFDVGLKGFLRRAKYWWRGAERSILPATGFGAYLIFAAAGLSQNLYFVVDHIRGQHYRIDLDRISEEIYLNPELRGHELISFREPELARNERIYRDRLPLHEVIEDYDKLKARINDPAVGYVLTDISEFPAVAALRPISAYRFVHPETIRRGWIVFISYVPGLTSLEPSRQGIDFGYQDESAMLYGLSKPIVISKTNARRMIEKEAAFTFPTDESHETLPVELTFNAAMTNPAVVSDTDVEVDVDTTNVGTIHVGGSRFRNYSIRVPPGAFHSSKSVISLKVLSANAVEKHQFIYLNWFSVDLITGSGGAAAAVTPQEFSPPKEAVGAPPEVREEGEEEQSEEGEN